MKKVVLILLIISSVAVAQDNWGPATGVPTLNFEIFADSNTRYLNFFNPVISPNDSLFFFDVEHLHYGGDYEEFIAYSFFENEAWQGPFIFEFDSTYISFSKLFYTDQFDTILYFAAGHETFGYGGSDIWGSELVNGNWTTPFSLGPIINTSENESDPSFPLDESFICFSRDYEFMYSNKVNGEFTEPILFPDYINTDTTQFYPTISPDGNSFYFTRSTLVPGRSMLYVSYLDGFVWGLPDTLNSYINQVYIPPDCPMHWGGVGAPTFSNGGSKMYFGRSVYYGPYCELAAYIMVSELGPSDIDETVEIPEKFNISAYPNPFNGKTKINISGSLEDITSIGIYDINGRLIRSLAVKSEIYWDGLNNNDKTVSSGIYFVTAELESHSKSVKITLLK